MADQRKGRLDQGVEPENVERDTSENEEARSARLVQAAEEAAKAEAERTAQMRTRTREHDSRVDELSEERATHQERPRAPWIRPSSLDAPPPREGYVQRWIRISVRGADDPRNVNMRFREGWRPREISTIPEDFMLLASRADAKAGHFVVDDLMLCEMPAEIYQQRRKYIREMTARQMEAVEHDLENAQVPGHRIERKHTSAVSMPARVIGRRVEAADD